MLAELKAHADTRRIPIMVVSGTETGDFNPEEVACVMRKPVTTEELIEAVEGCLRTLSMILPMGEGLV